MGTGIWSIAIIVVFGGGFLLWGAGSVVAFVLGRRAKTDGGRRTGLIIGWVAAALAVISLIPLILGVARLVLGIIS